MVGSLPENAPPPWGRRAAIGIDDDLAAGEAGVAIGAADDETPRRIDVELGLVVDPSLGQHLVDEAADDLLDTLGRGMLVMLGRHHDGIGAHGHAVFVDEGHLALGVGTEFRRAAGVPGLGHLMQNAMGIEDRCRHQRVRFAAGIAEHDALVARALVLVLRRVGIHAHGDIGRLLVQVVLERGEVPVEALLLVADFADSAPRRRLDGVAGHAFRAADLAGKHNMVGGDERLARDAGERIGCKVKVHHRVGNAVADFIGMAFRNRFTRKEVISSRHLRFPSYETLRPAGRVSGAGSGNTAGQGQVPAAGQA
ncbi:MAG: hypothetical protein A49_13390 [Methyloceanibacter sp.]|nr:MAG: hypothetical protein A49_13390 [Methyloceanibacter sp.]